MGYYATSKKDVLDYLWQLNWIHFQSWFSVTKAKCCVHTQMVKPYRKAELVGKGREGMGQGEGGTIHVGLLGVGNVLSLDMSDGYLVVCLVTIPYTQYFTCVA